jgi:hypothetical protein
MVIGGGGGEVAQSLRERKGVMEGDVLVSVFIICLS